MSRFFELTDLSSIQKHAVELVQYSSFRINDEYEESIPRLIDLSKKLSDDRVTLVEGVMRRGYTDVFQVLQYPKHYYLTRILAHIARPIDVFPGVVLFRESDIPKLCYVQYQYSNDPDILRAHRLPNNVVPDAYDLWTCYFENEGSRVLTSAQVEAMGDTCNMICVPHEVTLFRPQ